MVRVNYPPGGAAKIEEEVAREPKTVRVLKPPGGGSSICFTDDNDQQRQTAENGAASMPSQETPASAVQDSSPTTPSASEGKDTISTEIASSANSTNGMATKEHPSESPAEPPSPKPDPPQQTSSDVGLSNENSTEAVSCNGADTSSHSPTILNEINGQDTQVEHEVIVQEVATTSVKESKETTSTSSESHQITTQISTSDHVEAVEKDESVTATEVVQKHQPQQNGTTTVNGERSSSDSSRPAEVSPTSPSPSSCTQNSQPKDGKDTADRMLDQPAVKPNPTPQPRKIKDHMRSNIFMSDEDYTPTRSSRMNAAVVTESPPTVAAAGQRQRRIPPGGFSTKLW